MNKFSVNPITKTISKIIYFITTIFIILFVVSNDNVVDITLWPFPFIITSPLFLIVLTIFVVGFIGGYMYSYFKGLKNDKTK